MAIKAEIFFSQELQQFSFAFIPVYRRYTVAKILQEGAISDSSDVDKDGYDALMSGKDKMISGMKNK